MILAALGLFLIGLCYHSHGVRSGTLALVTTIGVVLALAWSRRAWSDRRICRMARELGLPCDVRLAISPGGLAKAPGADPDDPGRTFEWSEVLAVDRLDSLTVIHLHPAGGVLIVPDRAFATTEGRVNLVENIRGWRAAAVR